MTCSPRFLMVLVFALLAMPCLAAEPPVSADHAAKMVKGTALFKTSVRAILTTHCLRCHGGKKVESEFDMGTREKLLKGGHTGAVIVPNDSKKSLLFKLISHEKDPVMPENADKLSDADIRAVGDWIELGAPYDAPLVGKVDASAWTKTTITAEVRKHWAYAPLSKPGDPLSASIIDQMLITKRTAAGLKANAPAARRTLLRRITFDLIGLPPTPEELVAFETDTRPDAYERVVDRLLASPHYGERWARHWLDLTRFAESHGFEHDYDRPTAYHYRDFVIKAMNADMPFDTFAKWQIAGDEFAPGNALAESATGYLAAGVHSTQITANEVAKHRYDELDDILGNIGTTFLGLTVGCARCHDHKFDAIPARDYYRMLSTFTSTVRTEADLLFDPEAYAKAKAAFDVEHTPFTTALQSFERDRLPHNFAAWEAKRTDATLSLDWVLPDTIEMKSAGGATLTPQPDGSVLLSGTNPNTETLTFVLQSQERGIRGLRLEALAHPSLVKGGPGRAANGNFALSDIRVTATGKNSPKATKPLVIPLKNARATFEQNGLPVAAAIDDNPASAWAVDPQFGKDHVATFDFAEPVDYPDGTIFTITLRFQSNTGHGIGRPRFSIRTKATSADMRMSPVPERIPQALATPATKRTPQQVAMLLTWYAPQDTEWQKLNKATNEHTAKQPKPNAQKVLISTEGLQAVRLHSQGEDFLKETHFLRRGDPDQKEGVAEQSFLQSLMVTPESQSKWILPPPAGTRTTYRRKAFANWLMDVESGAGRLVARVIVNRLWQRLYGRGLVATPSDFGIRGEPPTHPELLDSLANELIRNGWKLRTIQKQMLMTAAYQQSAACDDATKRADPDNKWLGRFPVRRLEAEVIRDSIFAVSGQLDAKMYGPGTLDEGTKRRSIYFTMKRSKLIPALMVFDAPDGTVGIGERSNTTIAPQALHLMNNPHVRAAALALAKRVRSHDTVTDDAAIAAAYQVTLGRKPTAEEAKDAIAFLDDPQFRNKDAALADFCQVLFCTNEFVYIE